MTEPVIAKIVETRQQQSKIDTAPVTAPTTESFIRYIWCSAGISKKLEDVLCQFVIGQLQKGLNVSEYIFYISTTGGDPYAGVNLFSFLKSPPIKTTAYNMGMVASAGVPFFLGFKNREGVPNCSFMIHQTTINRNSFPENVNVFELQTQVQLLGGTDKKTQTIIETETKALAQTPLTLNEIETAIERSQIYQAADALKHGFIEKIEQPEISKTNTGDRVRLRRAQLPRPWAPVQSPHLGPATGFSPQRASRPGNYPCQSLQEHLSTNQLPLEPVAWGQGSSRKSITSPTPRSYTAEWRRGIRSFARTLSPYL
jgi:ATP-dependent protease ClpP protease subunit